MKKIVSYLSIFLTLQLLFSCGKDTKKTQSNALDSIQRPAKISRIIGVALIEPRSHIISLYSETGGVVAQINHDINEEVKAGEVILALNTDVEQAQLDQARSKLSTQEATLNASKAQLASAQVKADNASVNYERNKNLIATGGVTRQALDDSHFNLESLKADVNSFKANVAQQESKMRELQTDIAYYEKVIDRKKIKAPFNGRVLSMDVKVGNNMSPTQSACDFAPEGPLMAVTEVDELFADKVKEGMSAYIRPQGKTDTLATGKVFLTSPYLRKKSLFADAASDMEDRRVREVRVLLDQHARALIGSRVECVIQLN